MMSNNNNNNYPYSGYVPFQQPQVPQQQQQHFKVYVFENKSVPSQPQALDVQKATSIHRLVIPYLTSLNEFLKFLEERKIIENNASEPQQTIFYLDDENQWVTVSNEDDWNVLWSLLRGQKVIKVSILKKQQQTASVPSQEEAFEQQQQHTHEKLSFNLPWFGAQRRGCCPRRKRFQHSSHGHHQQEANEIPLSNLIDHVLGAFFETPSENDAQESGNKNEEKKEEANKCCNADNNNNCRSNASQTERSQCPFVSGSSCGSNGHPFAHLFPFLGEFGRCFNSNNNAANNFSFSPEQREQLRQQFGGLINLAKENVNNIPHFGVTCDECNQSNFVGQRLKCQDCEDFDLCGKCFEEKAQQHAEGFHSFTLVEPRGKSFVQNLISQFEQQQNETVGQQQSTSPQASSDQASDQHQPKETVVVSEPSAPHSQVDEQPQELELDAQLYPSVDNNNNGIVTNTTAQQPTQTVQEHPYSQQLSILRDMGFNSEELNLRLLNKYNGDIQRTVADLLSYY
ncbi:hypothetical protein FDP41_006830 [Naegleria fowleri]|uniref:ZZ-type domain-containing protein n=1 Tax=Naegleria fowleri TaxID=5763 RepID=A0A6A5BJL6_NAEFO|nr:uncharacterized protein FDP41_006830 [Naegleria fowleri]KAF0974220.1 hypothetical protein FDP41_006830 [Naegleria fowleri]